jgi:hypothetical protein
MIRVSAAGRKTTYRTISATALDRCRRIFITVMKKVRHRGPTRPSVLPFEYRERYGVNRNVTTSPSCIT